MNIAIRTTSTQLSRHAIMYSIRGVVNELTQPVFLEDLNLDAWVSEEDLVYLDELKARRMK